MNDMPEGFPLPSIDSKGRPIKEGDTIRIDVIPDSLVSSLEEDEKATVKGCEGKEMEIIEIDKYGFVWVEVVVLHTETEYIPHSFSLEPQHVTKV